VSDLPEFPHDLLRIPMREGYGFSPVSPLMRTNMESGRAKQRRRYQSTPTQVPVTWRFRDEGQCQLFESWYKYIISDGTSWFNSKLKTPEGIKQYKCRFMDIYTGPLLDGLDWVYTAELELWERPTMDPLWVTYYPAAIRYMNVIDLALNREWPEA
jgi:hypothetical protein